MKAGNANKVLVIAGLALILTGLAAVKPVRVRAYMTAKQLASDNVTIVVKKWDSSVFPITWQMNPTVGANIAGGATGRQQSDVLNLAFQQWTSAAPVTVKQGANSAPTVKANQYDGINLITSNTSPTDLPAGVLAYTYVFTASNGGANVAPDQFGRSYLYSGQIIEADMAFSPTAAYSLASTVPSNSVDFQSVATHEAGHFLGMDHATDVSSTMFWTLAAGYQYPRGISTDDIAGISTIYPPASFASMGTLSGKVMTTAGTGVYGAIVVAVNSNGSPVASSITDPNGAYSIQGLPPGAYTVYAEPLAGRIGVTNIYSLSAIYPSSTVNTNFTTRFH